MTVRHIEAQLRAKLEADQKDEVLNHQVHEAIGTVLQSFVGKKLTKRFTDKVTAAIVPIFQSRPIVYYPNPGELVLWGANAIAYDQRRVFCIAGAPHHADPEHSALHPTLEGFERSDACHGSAAKGRIAERAGLLSEGSIALFTIAEAIHAAQEANERVRMICASFGIGLQGVAEDLAKERSAS